MLAYSCMWRLYGYFEFSICTQDWSNRAHIHMYNKVEQTFKCTTGEAIKKMQKKKYGKSDVERADNNTLVPLSL